MAKMIRVTMPDDTVWDVPASVIASNWARYYAASDPSSTFANEFALAMGDDSGLLDWASNNTDWVDVAESAVRVQIEPSTADYDRWWTNAHKEVIEEDR
jgi:hypothetical protein